MGAKDESNSDPLPSFRRRYAQIFIILALVFATITGLTYRYVADRSSAAIAEAALHEHSVGVLNETFARLYAIGAALHHFELEPSTAGHARLLTELRALHDAMARFADRGDRPHDIEFRDVSRELRTDARALLDRARGLSRVNEDTQLHAAAVARIKGTLQTMRERLDDLRLEIQTAHRRQVDMLSNAGIGIGNALFAALGLLLVFGIAGYLTLDRLILRPIFTLAEGFKVRAGRSDDGVPTPPVVSETRDLLAAFDAIHDEVQQREHELDHLAHHDALTGLPNRALFRRRLGEAIEYAGEHGQPVGLLFMDLDRFKQINDSYGHAAGDAMLTEISNRLIRVFRQDDVVARLGGDEFAVLLENIHAREEMTLLAEKALSAVERPYSYGGNLFYSGASMGIAVAPDDGTDPDRLIQLADAAMYASKQEEGSSYRFVSSELSTLAAARHALENELRSAIQQHELELHFQPVVSLRDGSLHGYEALLRWPHAEQGLLQPASFMDALSDAGLCGTISDWAFDQIESRRPADDAVVSINLSARLLHDESFSRRLFERIDQGRIVPSQLILEITEDTLETDLRAAARVLHELKKRGVRIALDDFGTGQASLSHLRRFPFDYLKIDQSFIAGIGKVRNDEKLIHAVIGLAHDLGMQVVAEGVETAEQRIFLAAEQCDYLQGYLVGRPSVTGQSVPTRQNPDND